jgi:hypothetical protein
MRLGAGQGTVAVLMWPTLRPTMGSARPAVRYVIHRSFLRLCNDAISLLGSVIVFGVRALSGGTHRRRQRSLRAHLPSIRRERGMLAAGPPAEVARHQQQARTRQKPSHLVRLDEFHNLIASSVSEIHFTISRLMPTPKCAASLTARKLEDLQFRSLRGSIERGPTMSAGFFARLWSESKDCPIRTIPPLSTRT